MFFLFDGLNQAVNFRGNYSDKMITTEHNFWNHFHFT